MLPDKDGSVLPAGRNPRARAINGRTQDGSPVLGPDHRFLIAGGLPETDLSVRSPGHELVSRGGKGQVSDDSGVFAQDSFRGVRGPGVPENNGAVRSSGS